MKLAVSVSVHSGSQPVPYLRQRWGSEWWSYAGVALGEVGKDENNVSQGRSSHNFFDAHTEVKFLHMCRRRRTLLYALVATPGASLIFLRNFKIANSSQLSSNEKSFLSASNKKRPIESHLSDCRSCIVEAATRFEAYYHSSPFSYLLPALSF